MHFAGKLLSKMQGREKFVYDDNTVAFIRSLATDLYHDDKVESFRTYGTLDLFSSITKNNKQKFHAMPYYRGKSWYDWAIFDLSDPDSETPTTRRFVPAQIKCFLDFTDIPQENALMKPPGIYAIIEPSNPSAGDPEQLWWSELIEPIAKSPCQIAGFQSNHNHQELVSIDQIRQAAVVVPDLQNPNKRAYLRLVSRSVWDKMFDDWLEAPHTREHE